MRLPFLSPLSAVQEGVKEGARERKKQGDRESWKLKRKREEIRHCGCVTRYIYIVVKGKWGKPVPGIS